MDEGEENQEVLEPLFKPLSETSLLSQETSVKSPNKKYADGNVLPNKLRSRFLLEAKPCTPLEEIDPYYRDKQTFVVLGRWGTVHRYSRNSTTKYFSLPPSSALRRFAIHLETNWIFSAFIVFTLLVNMVALITTKSIEIWCGMDYYYCDRYRNYYFLYVVDYVCLAVYCVEFVAKLLARGIIGGEFSAFRDPWIWLDGFVIYQGFRQYGEFILTRRSLFFVRIFKFIPLIPRIRHAFRLSLKAIKNLAGLLLILGCFLWFFSLLGLQVYMGTLTQKCIKQIPNDTEITDEIWKNYINENGQKWQYPNQNTPFKICGNSTGSSQCAEDEICMQGIYPNPDHGFTNFDNIFYSLLSVIRIASEDYTEEIYTQLVSANGPWHLTFISAIFFVITFPIGCLLFSILGKLYSEHAKDDENEGRCAGKRDRPLDQEEVEGIRKTLQSLISQGWTKCLIICVIMVDIFGITLYGYGLEENDKAYEFIIYGIPYSVCVVYTVELLVKLVANGPVKHFKDGWNVLDFFLLLTLFNQVFQFTGHANSPIRLLKLVQYWSSLRIIFTIYRKTLCRLWGWILYGIIVMGFLVLIAPFEVGMYETDDYRGKTNITSDDIPRFTFIDFWHSFRNIVRMQIAEWVETLWDIMPRAASSVYIFYLACNLCGGLLISYFFVGIVYTSLEEFKKEGKEKKVLEYILCKVRPFIKSAKKEDSFDKQPTTENDVEKEKQDEKDEPTKPVVASGELRKTLQALTDHWIYRLACIGIIIIASIAMICEDKYSGQNMQTGLFIIEILFTITFLLIAVFEFVTHGVKQAIMKRGTLFDAIIVLENILNLTVLQFAVAGPFRVGIFCLRSFRPLMLISRMPCLTASFRAIKADLKLIGESILAIFFIWLMFDTFAVHHLAGEFHKCIDWETGKEIRVEKTQCLMRNLTWENSQNNFDSASTGFVNMIYLVSRMGWVDIINDASDAVAVDMPRSKDVSKMWLIYFILVVLFGGLGALGILFAQVFTKIKNSHGFLIFTNIQLVKYAEIKSEKESAPTGIALEDENISCPENSGCRQSVYKFVTNWYFDAVVMVVIILDLVMISLDHYELTPTWETILTYWNLILVFYTVEMLLKIVAWGRHYFATGQNQLDALVVLSGLAGMILSDYVEKYFVSPGLLRMLRLFRIFRFLRGKRWGSKSAKVLVSAVENVKPALGNFLCFQFVIMWAFALLGMYLFDNVRIDKGGLNDQINFKTFGSSWRILALLLGFPCLDGLISGAGNEEDCEIDDPELGTYEGNCGNRKAAVTYVGLYAGITFMVLLNMYAVLINEMLEEFERYNNKEVVKCEEEKVVKEEELNDENVEDEPEVKVDIEENPVSGEETKLGVD